MPTHTLLLAALAFPSLTLAQGDLAPPPGGPQPSMKTLQQVEPRTDLFNAPENLVSTNNTDFHFEIKAPGSYYLSRNTSVVGANLLYEMLCVLPGVQYVER